MELTTTAELLRLDLHDGFALDNGQRVVAIQLQVATYASEQRARRAAEEVAKTADGYRILERQSTYDDLALCGQIEAWLDEHGEPLPAVPTTPKILGRLTDVDMEQLRLRIGGIYVAERQRHGLLPSADDAPEADDDPKPMTAVLRTAAGRLVKAGWSQDAIDTMPMAEFLGYLQDMDEQAQAAYEAAHKAAQQ